MAIESLTRDYGVTPCIVRMLTSDDLATITTAGYLNTQTIAFNAINGGAFQWASTDIVLADFNGGQAFFTLSPDFSSLIDFFEPGGGTVTSVAMTVPAFLSIAGSPITTSGTLAVTLSGTALPVINGGTGLTATTINDLLYSSANNVIGQVAAVNDGVLISGTTGVPSWLANSGTPGFVLTANTGAPPSWKAITSEGAITTIDGDSGSIAPVAGVVTISGGSTGLTTSGSGAILDLVGVLNLASGGSNANLTASNGSVVYSTASAMAFSGVGASGQLFISQGAAAPIWTTSTYPTTNAINTLLYASSANTMAALPTANDGVLITSNTGVPSWLANSGTPGFVLTANAGAPPSWQNIQAEGAITAVNADAGTATPSAGAITISGGSTGLTTSASASTLDIVGILSLASGGTNANLTASNGGIFYSTATAGAILAGTVTARQVLLSGSSSAPVWSTATYPATTTINQILYSSAANVITGLATADNGVLITGTTGTPSVLANSGTPGFVLTANTGAPPSWQAISAEGAIITIDGDVGSVAAVGGVVTISGGTTGLTTSGSGAILDLTGTLGVANGGLGSTATPSDGFVPIGNGTNYVSAALTSGSGISIVNGAGSITISSTGGGLGWVAAASTPITAVINTGYYITDASQVSITLPAVAAAGSVIAIAGNGAGGWIMLPGAGQTIQVLTQTASTSITSAEQYDCIEVLCVVADTTWVARSVVTTGFTIL